MTATTVSPDWALVGASPKVRVSHVPLAITTPPMLPSPTVHTAVLDRLKPPEAMLAELTEPAARAVEVTAPEARAPGPTAPAASALGPTAPTARDGSG